MQRGARFASPQPLSGMASKTCGICGDGRAKNLPRARNALGGPLSETGIDGLILAMPKSRTSPKNLSCDDCYFKRNLLCALELQDPCSTYRPDSPEGLRPPQQLRFTFRQERRTKAAWAFPSAQEQAALHASH